MVRVGVVVERRPVVKDPAVVDKVDLAGSSVNSTRRSGAFSTASSASRALRRLGRQRLAGLFVPGLDPVAEVTEAVRLGPRRVDDGRRTVGDSPSRTPPRRST